MNPVGEGANLVRTVVIGDGLKEVGRKFRKNLGNDYKKRFEDQRLDCVQTQREVPLEILQML